MFRTIGLLILFLGFFTTQMSAAGVYAPISKPANYEAKSLEKDPKTVKVAKKVTFLQKVIKGVKKVASFSKGLAIILMIFIAPLAWLWVGLYRDWDNAWWITLLLCFLFFFPGWIFGLIKILQK